MHSFTFLSPSITNSYLSYKLKFELQISNNLRIQFTKISNSIQYFIIHFSHYKNYFIIYRMKNSKSFFLLFDYSIKLQCVYLQNQLSYNNKKLQIRITMHLIKSNFQDFEDNFNMRFQNFSQIKQTKQDRIVASICKQQLPKFIRILVYSYLSLKVLAIKLVSLSQKERHMVEQSSILIDGDLTFPDIIIDDTKFSHQLRAFQNIQTTYQNSLILRLYKRVKIFFLPTDKVQISGLDICNYLDTVLNKIQRTVIVDISANQQSKIFLPHLLNFQKVEFNKLEIRQQQINSFEFNTLAKAFKTIEINDCFFIDSFYHFPQNGSSKYRLRYLYDYSYSKDRNVISHPEQYDKILSNLEELQIQSSSKFFLKTHEFALAIKNLKKLKLVFKKNFSQTVQHSLLSCLSEMTKLEQLHLKLDYFDKQSPQEVFDYLCELLEQRQQQDLTLERVVFDIMDKDICLHHLLDKISLLQGKSLNQLIIRLGMKSQLMLMNTHFKVEEEIKHCQLQEITYQNKAQEQYSVKKYIKFSDQSQSYSNQYDLKVKDMRDFLSNQYINLKFSRKGLHQMGPKMIEVNCYEIKVY